MVQLKTFTMHPAEQYDRQVVKQLDGHYCYDWDDLAVSAFTPEYGACGDYPKTIIGRIVNWFVMKKFVWEEAKVRAQADFDAKYGGDNGNASDSSL